MPAEYILDRRYSPLANLLYKVTQSAPTAEGERLAMSPSSYMLEKFGVPDDLPTGIKSSWKTPASYGINLTDNLMNKAVSDRDLLGNASDFMIGFSLGKTPALAAKYGPKIQAAAVRGGRLAKTAYTTWDTGYTPLQITAEQAARARKFADLPSQVSAPRTPEAIKADLLKKFREITAQNVFEKKINLRGAMGEFSDMPEISGPAGLGHALGNKMSLAVPGPMHLAKEAMAALRRDPEQALSNFSERILKKASESGDPTAKRFFDEMFGLIDPWELQ